MGMANGGVFQSPQGVVHGHGEPREVGGLRGLGQQSGHATPQVAKRRKVLTQTPPPAIRMSNEDGRGVRQGVAHEHSDLPEV